MDRTVGFFELGFQNPVMAEIPRHNIKHIVYFPPARITKLGGERKREEESLYSSRVFIPVLSAFPACILFGIHNLTTLPTSEGPMQRWTFGI